VAKNLGAQFKAVLHLPHSQTDQEKHQEEERVEEQKEREHQERLRVMRDKDEGGVKG
jgi:hypothetical protein